MGTDFFERQRRARTQTLWLRLVFALALALASLLVAFGAVLLLTTIGLGGLIGDMRTGMVHIAFVEGHRGWFIAGGVFTFSLMACAATAWRLRDGGAALARALRARRVHPESSHPPERQLLNIVAEMSLASGVPQPEIYVLEREKAINAFAAGKNIEGAVIGVTGGALRDLDRDEMQAVIAHEYSHILNGDMALNTRLTAWLSGFFVIERIARSWRRDKDSKAGVGMLFFWWAHLGFWFFHTCGYISLLIGRLLQAAICRRREALADASAVQFTRNPAALKSALLKIEASQGAGRIQASAASGMAHMFFTSGDDGVAGWLQKLWGGWLRTHPTMEERVRVLDVRMTSTQYRAAVRETRKQQLRAQDQAAAPVKVAGETLRAAPEAPLRAADVPPDLLCSRLNAAQQRAVLALHAEYAQPGPALAALYVAGLLDTAPQRARQQLLSLAPVLGAGIASRVAPAMNRLNTLAPIARLPLLTGLFATLAQLCAADRARIAKVTRAFSAQIPPVDAFRFTLSRLLLRTLVHAPAPAAAVPGEPLPTVDRYAAQISLLCSLVARFSGERAPRAYQAGLDGLIPAIRRPPYSAAAPDGEAVDAAIAQVATLPYAARTGLGAALLRIIAANGSMGAAEFDLLRLVSSSIGIPTPGAGSLRLEPTAAP